MTEQSNTPELRFPEFKDEWTQSFLDQLGDFKKSYSLSRSYEGNGDYRYIHYGDIHSRFPSILKFANIIPTITEIKDFEEIEKGDLIFADASEDYKDLGKTILADFNDSKIIAGLHTHLFRPKNFIDSRFLLYNTKTNNYLKFIRKQGTGISVLGISKKNLSKYLMSLPSSEEQYKISNFFSKLDRQIKLEEEKLALFEQQKKGYMQKIFSQELRFKDDNGCDYSNWEMKKLDKIANYRRGSFPQPYGNKEWYDELNGEPFVQVVDVDKNMQLHEQTKQRISDLAKSKSVKGYKGDIVVTLQGSIGRVAILQYDAYIDRTLLLINSFKIDINKNYFKYALYLLFLKEKEKAPGGTIKTITKTVLSNFIINVPSIKEQVKIGNFLEKLDYLIEKQTLKVETLQQRKQGLLQKMFV
ncbi:restriction endonuclease subunit S [Staphylococcus caprae]|uniref:restriction endonuclease subunit S n=1 Tax=Staphylococcus caprae TaxID=29380 RepID=UPI0030C2E815